MTKVFGPRTAVEAVLVVAAPVGTLLAGQGKWVIIAVAGIVYLLVIVTEAYLGRGAPLQPAAPAPEPARVGAPEPVPEPEPAVAAPDPEPEPEPDIPPAAEQEEAKVPEPTVVPIGVGAAPRQWNLWDLERLTREHAGTDEARDEERSFLLMYLRDFAGADGLLPIDFDGLVRDSFGELVGAR